MKIHHLVSDGNQAVAITQSASSGGGYAHPVKLSAIRFNVKDAEAVLQELNKSGHRGGFNRSMQQLVDIARLVFRNPRSYVVAHSSAWPLR
ncbi:hypothetical protein WP1W18C01_13990 [Stenotrophomonas maltophilia]|nr:hypothetical protein WP1W18C01_13990 [Stenotrophomonas maltophilia]